MRIVENGHFLYLIENEAGEVVGEVLVPDYEFILYAYGERHGVVESLQHALEIVERLELKLDEHKQALKDLYTEMSNDLEYVCARSKELIQKECEKLETMIERLESMMRGEFE